MIKVLFIKLAGVITVSAIFLSCLITSVYCQNKSDEFTGKTRAVFGFGFADLLHAGLMYKLGKADHVGISAGIVPLPLEGLVLSITAEHRLYLGKDNSSTGNKQWFCRQSFSYISDRESGGSLSITVGKDFSKVPRRGFTADAGIQIPLPKETGDRDFYGEIRIQYYFFRGRNSRLLYNK